MSSFGKIGSLGPAAILTWSAKLREKSSSRLAGRRRSEPAGARARNHGLHGVNHDHLRSSTSARRRHCAYVCASLLVVALASASRAQPFNDRFAFAVPITYGSTVFISNAGATAEPGEPVGLGSGTNSLWWQLVATAATITINTCGSDFDTVLEVFSGNTLASLAFVTGNGDFAGCGGTGLQSQVSFVAAAGTQYWIRVVGVGNSTGNIRLTVGGGHTARIANFLFGCDGTNKRFQFAAGNGGPSNPHLPAFSSILIVGGEITLFENNGGLQYVLLAAEGDRTRQIANMGLVSSARSPGGAQHIFNAHIRSAIPVIVDFSGQVLLQADGACDPGFGRMQGSFTVWFAGATLP